MGDAFDAEHRLWQTLGGEETGAEAFVPPAAMVVLPDNSRPTWPAEVLAAQKEVCRSGIESDKNFGN